MLRDLSQLLRPLVGTAVDYVMHMFVLMLLK